MHYRRSQTPGASLYPSHRLPTADHERYPFAVGITFFQHQTGPLYLNNHLIGLFLKYSR
jgi:hypothetical protein